MTGAKHTDNDIIYDTPQESRTSRGMMSTSTPYTTVSSAQVQTNVSDTTTTSQPDTSSQVVSLKLTQTRHIKSTNVWTELHSSSF